MVTLNAVKNVSEYRLETMQDKHDTGEWILWPDAQPDPAKMGGKAATLAQLSHAVPIPDWFVITPQVFLTTVNAAEQAQLAQDHTSASLAMPATVKAAILQAVARLDADSEARFAVRSSAIGEDGTAASFAGQLQSFLHLRREEIVEHVCAVWQSAFTASVQRYQQRVVGQSNPCIPGVIVQRMVEADVAGVAFSVDPVSGDRARCLITAVAGVADRLVAGEVNGDSYCANRSGVVQSQTLMGEHPLLSPGQIDAIVEVLLYVEKFFGTAQDMEWAIRNGQLFLLQARPITTLANTRDDQAEAVEQPSDLIIWDNSNIVESYSGVTSPLTFTFARYAYEHVYIAFCRLMGVTESKIESEHETFRNMLGTVNGHVYYNLINWYRALALFPGFALNRQFMEQMMGVKQPLPVAVLEQILSPTPSLGARLVDALHLAGVGLRLLWNQLMLPNTIRRFYQQLDAALSRSTAELQTLSLQELAAEYAKVESKLLTRWDAPLINDFLCMIAFGLSRKLLERWAGAAGLQLHSDLLIGQGDIISAEPARRIQAMATLAAQHPLLVEKLVGADSEAALNEIAAYPTLQKEFDSYLARFGNRCLQELKLESPTLQDDPSSLLRAIGEMARRTPPAPEQASSTTDERALATLLPEQPLKCWLATRLVNWAKARVRDRENLRFERTRVFGHARQIFLAMGRRLTESQQIDDAKDVFYLEVDELKAIGAGKALPTQLYELVAQRKNEQARFSAQPAPPSRFSSIGSTNAAIQAGIAQARGTTSNTNFAQANATETRTGIGCCAGIVRAPVRLIHDPRSETIQAGEIMVARFTDPGWITLFANAAGILVERGSLLSHSAIVARELGIPAIVAVDGVMEWLQSGELVEMNGATGAVRRVQRSY